MISCAQLSDVYRSVLDKISFHFESLGDQKMKNTENPVHIYEVVMDTPDKPSRGPYRAVLESQSI